LQVDVGISYVPFVSFVDDYKTMDDSSRELACLLCHVSSLGTHIRRPSPSPRPEQHGRKHGKALWRLFFLLFSSNTALLSLLVNEEKDDPES